MATRYPLVLNGSSIQELQPGDTLEANAGTANLATNSNFLRVNGTVYREATVDTPDNGTPNTIPCRDSGGNLNAVQFQGTATSALFADLAEKYLADKEYDVGTVVMVGGDAEVTACTLASRAFGAVSANPAFKMNDGLAGGTHIALKGRVPVKVIGPVNKGDKLVAANNGCAGTANFLEIQSETFAIALYSSDDHGVKLIESIII